MSNDLPAVETDVLVVGSGPGGAGAALFLATYGTRTMVITRYGHLSDTPRAHITNQRTMETLRDMGLEQRLMREATPWESMGNTTFCTSLAGEELGRIPSWGTDTRRHHDYELQSPCTMLDAPQTITEPVMMQAAQARGAKVRFDTEYLSHEQDDSGVTTQVRDRLTGATYAIRSRYLVGADGARSKVAADLGLPFEGPGAVAGALHIIFEADLSRFVEYRPSVLYWMVQPGAEKEGVGLGVLRMIRPWTEWMLMWGYEVAAGPPEITDEFARELAVQLVGTGDFEMRVTSRLPWTVNHHFATTVARGRVYCVGDAVHRHPPTNGLGSNTSIQDSYNLAWKLHHVVAGLAGPSLLDSYDAERAPVARQIVERANQSIADTGTHRRRAGRGRHHRRGQTQPAARAAQGARPGGREDPREPARGHRVQGVRVRRARRGAQPPLRLGRGRPGRHGQPCVQPGPGAVRPAHHLAWREAAAHLGHPRGPPGLHLDLAGHGTFSVWTGIGGQAWLDAAAAFTADTGLPVTPVSVGPGQPFEDPYGTWAELREISDGGVLLVRPDLYIAARHASAPDSPESAARWLRDTLTSVLGTA